MTACVATFDQCHDEINDIYAEGAVEGFTDEMIPSRKYSSSAVAMIVEFELIRKKTLKIKYKEAKKK